MKISLITPAPAGSLGGNRTTAVRWATLLEELGHAVELAVDYTDADADMMIALHAWRSAGSIVRFRRLHPNRLLVVGLAGTDVYRDLECHRATVLGSLDSADALIGLHDLVADAIPERYRDKVTVIFQSAQPAAGPAKRRTDRFEVLIAGHLRDEKDPLRTAYAARMLPPDSRLAVVHLGRAYTSDWAMRAKAEMAENSRYEWLGEVSGEEVRGWLARAMLIVLSSIMEGGANVISEAVVARLPVLASRIDGSVGLLGRDYPGYFPTGDTDALADLLARAEEDGAFLATLRRHCADRAALFTPDHERSQWQRLLERLRCRQRSPRSMHVAR